MSNRTPLERFAARVAAQPDSAAVRDEQAELTYGQLDAAADEVAARLSAAGLRPGARVGLRLSRDRRVAVAIVGLAKAGLAYVPLDPAYPSGRTALIEREATLSAVLEDRDFEDTQLRAVRLCQGASAASLQPGLAYVIYTSGSTGVPKGVAIGVEQLAALFEATGSLFDFEARDVWALMHSYNFDFSVWELWGAWTTGGCLAIPSQPVLRSPGRTVEWLAQSGVTVLNLVPSVFEHLVDTLRDSGTRLPSIRHVIFGGEELRPGAVAGWRELGHTGALTNMYGITEVTVHATFRRLGQTEIPDFPASIGTPLPGFEFQVLDTALQPVEPGDQGQLFLRGPQVAAGYLNNPQRTAEQFVELGGPGTGHWYASGDLVLLGRTGSCGMSGVPTARSSCAATASNSARSRRSFCNLTVSRGLL